MRTILFTLILLSTAVLIPSTVYAQRQMQCVPYKEAISMIANDFKEVLLNRGLERNGASMIEVWANEDTGTFTIIRVMHIPVGSKPRKAICAREKRRGQQNLGVDKHLIICYNNYNE